MLPWHSDICDLASFAIKTVDQGNTPTLNVIMFKKLKELYREYKPYIKGDLIMYAFMILLVFFYILYRVIFT